MSKPTVTTTVTPTSGSLYSNSNMPNPFYSTTYTFPTTLTYPTSTYDGWTVTTPVIAMSDVNVKFQMDDGSYIEFPRADLVKYICDQPLREENEVVRTLWDRYQVAVKLVRSNDDGNHGS